MGGKILDFDKFIAQKISLPSNLVSNLFNLIKVESLENNHCNQNLDLKSK